VTFSADQILVGGRRQGLGAPFAGTGYRFQEEPVQAVGILTVLDCLGGASTFWVIGGSPTIRNEGLFDIQGGGSLIVSSPYWGDRASLIFNNTGTIRKSGAARTHHASPCLTLS
jgi:hypothetical protein